MNYQQQFSSDSNTKVSESLIQEESSPNVGISRDRAAMPATFNGAPALIMSLILMCPVVNPTTFDGVLVGSKKANCAPMAPGTMSSRGCTFMGSASSMRSGNTSVVVALLDVNSVIVALITQARGAIAKYGAARRKSRFDDITSVRPLVRTPSAIAKPAPRRRMMFHGNFLHLF